MAGGAAAANIPNNLFNPGAGVFFGIQLPRQQFLFPNQQQQQQPLINNNNQQQQQQPQQQQPQQQAQQLNQGPFGVPPIFGLPPFPAFGFGGVPFNQPFGAPVPFGFGAGGVLPQPFMRFFPPPPQEQQQPTEALNTNIGESNSTQNLQNEQNQSSTASTTINSETLSSENISNAQTANAQPSTAGPVPNILVCFFYKFI